MSKINDVLNDLRKLDLSLRPVQEIVELFRMIGPTVNINLRLGSNKIFLKARLNEDCPRFTETEDLSIKPAKYNSDFQRASTPANTMFYGVYIPSIINDKELNIMRATGVYETIPDARIPYREFHKKVTFGYWRNKENLNLVSVMHKETYSSKNVYTKELVNAYNEHLLGCDRLIRENSLAFYDFLADEFSKENIRGNYDYMISALFSEAASRGNVDGVIYPSVRVGGVCYCIAITESAMRKLELISVEEAAVSQIENNVKIVVKAFAKIEKNQMNFTLLDAPTKNNKES